MHDKWKSVYVPKLLPGDIVTYEPLLREGNKLLTVARSEPWRLGHGEPVISVDGKTGGLCMDHIEVVCGNGDRHQCMEPLEHGTLSCPMCGSEYTDRQLLAVTEMTLYKKSRDRRPSEYDLCCRSHPVCPHCGYEEVDDEVVVYEDGLSTIWTCNGCSEVFHVTVHVTYLYTTRKTTEKEES
jgi:ribosomal protein L37AE/L43A